MLYLGLESLGKRKHLWVAAPDSGGHHRELRSGRWSGAERAGFSRPQRADLRGRARTLRLLPLRGLRKVRAQAGRCGAARLLPARGVSERNSINVRCSARRVWPQKCFIADPPVSSLFHRWALGADMLLKPCRKRHCSLFHRCFIAHVSSLSHRCFIATVSVVLVGWRRN